ncbi:zinc ribbon domain-containing protein [Umezakia ovalisporum]|uniref:zinc ribbon domain-containing protein n=1 Tax=Umezakia ovalisporum TaxID=75695 RepID=UPI003F68AB5A
MKKSLSTRTHKCSCGCELQRDVNAAVNVLNLGKNRGGHRRSRSVPSGILTLQELKPLLSLEQAWLSKF